MGHPVYHTGVSHLYKARVDNKCSYTTLEYIVIVAQSYANTLFA